MFHVLLYGVETMQPSPWDDDSVKTNDPAAPQSIQMNAPMSTQDPFSTQPVETQQPMIMGAPSQPYGYGQQPIIIQQAPSSAAKIIGILVIIYASLSLFGEGFGIMFAPGGNGLTIALAAVNILAYGGMIIGGVQMMQFNRQGVFIVMGAIALVAFSTIASLQVALDYDQMLENGDISQEEYDVITDENLDGAVTVVGTITAAICSGICMAIVAIPLMIANNGFQSQKNYGMTP